MKLWEALEKYDRVKRTGWSDEEKNNCFVKNTTDDRMYITLKIVDFFADDWVAYEDPMTCAQAKALEEIAKLKALAQPLCDYLYDKGTPHDSIIITQEGVQHLQGYRAAPFEIRD